MMKIFKPVTYDEIKDMVVIDIQMFVYIPGVTYRIGSLFTENFDPKQESKLIYYIHTIDTPSGLDAEIIVVKSLDKVEEMKLLVEIDDIEELEDFKGREFYLYEVDDLEDIVVEYKGKHYLPENITPGKMISIDECKFLEVESIEYIADA